MKSYEDWNEPIKDRRLYDQAVEWGVSGILHVWLLEKIVGPIRALEHIQQAMELDKANQLLELRLRNAAYLHEAEPDDLARVGQELRQAFGIQQDAQILDGAGQGPACVVIGFEDAWKLKRDYDFRNELGEILGGNEGLDIAF